VHKNLILMVALVPMALAGCAGRDAAPVSAYSPRDNNLSCEQIDGEIAASNERMVSLAVESKEKEQQNIAAGAAGAIIFLPALFFMDFKGAADTDLAAQVERNRVLDQLAAEKDCDAEEPLTQQQALDKAAEILREKAKEDG